MKAVVYEGIGEVRLADVPEPKLVRKNFSLNRSPSVRRLRPTGPSIAMRQAG
jgi:hypothetical protein